EEAYGLLPGNHEGQFEEFWQFYTDGILVPRRIDVNGVSVFYLKRPGHFVTVVGSGKYTFVKTHQSFGYLLDY
ncbi:hypothetical protein ACYJ67_28550, partial [Klebsiella pneumoniae]